MKVVPRLLPGKPVGTTTGSFNCPVADQMDELLGVGGAVFNALWDVGEAEPPPRDCGVSAALRNAARACAALGARTRQRSSSKVVSRTQCNRFSIPQCRRQIPSSRAASARSGRRLVIA